MSIRNNGAFFHYEIIQKYTAGIVLFGTEVKSIRKGKASFNDSFCVVHGGEVFIRHLFISPYELGTSANHEPLRERKLLLNKKEIGEIERKIKEKGLTLIPLSLFITSGGNVKVDIGLARGKKVYDKRESIKKKDLERELKRKFK